MRRNLAGGAETAGKHLKATSDWSWYDNDLYGGLNVKGQDTYGFSALPGGNGSSGGSFSNVGNFGSWWSASEINSSSAHFSTMDYNNEYVHWYNGGKGGLYSVRCLQDSP